MADLSPETVDRFVAAAAARIAELTGLDQAVAEDLAVSAIPPCELDGEDVLLTNGDGVLVARVRQSDLDPDGILEGIE